MAEDAAMMAVSLLAGAIGVASAAIVLWPLRRGAPRMCAVVALLIGLATMAAYTLLGNASQLDRIAADQAMNADFRNILQAHMHAVAAHPEDAAEWHAFGRDLLLGGRYAEAAAAFEQALSHGGASRGVFDVLTARYLASGGELGDDAEPWLEKARSAFPGDPQTRYFTALRQLALGHPEQARPIFAELRRTLPAGSPLAVLVEGQRARSEHPNAAQQR